MQNDARNTMEHTKKKRDKHKKDAYRIRRESQKTKEDETNTNTVIRITITETFTDDANDLKCRSSYSPIAEEWDPNPEEYLI